MSSRSVSGPTDGILCNKRVCIDEQAASAPASTASTPTKNQTRTAAAKARIESIATMLPQEMKPTVIKLANEIFISYTRYFIKKKKHDE